LRTKEKEKELYTNTKNENNKDISGMDAGAMLTLFGGIVSFMWWNKNASKVEVWYFNHFEEIYLAFYFILITLLFFIVLKIRKSTEKMNLRASLLSFLWEKRFDNIAIGKTTDGVDLFLDNKSRCAHVQVIGTTGSGKSQSVVIPWSIRDIQRGHSSIIIDGKGSRDLACDIFSKIEDGACEKLHFDLGDINNSIKMNPLMYGSAQQITDRIFTSFEFDDPYYRSVQYDICGNLIQLIKELGEIVSFKLLHELLTSDIKLSEYVSKLEDSALKSTLKSYLKEPARDRKNKLSGLISQISPFAIGEISELVNADTSEFKNALLSTGGVRCLIFSIPTLKYQKLGHQLGKLLLQELAWCVGKRETLASKDFISVFLDEFSEFCYDEFISVLNKARSSKVALHLCHQSISDLTKVSESFARGINTCTNVKCVLGVNDPETADFYARHFGTQKSQKLTEQVREAGWFRNKEETGRGSMREVEEYKVHPNILKELYEGNGVIHLPTTRGTITERIKFKAITQKEVSIA
tara:strand:- start:1127 stop:2695 length:1569 start_codon:yes stop_codon:yes gene_type:complete